MEVVDVYRDDEEENVKILTTLGGYYALKSAVDGFLEQKKVTEHDAVLAMKLANILTGGNIPNVAFVSEQRVLDLELEAFLELCGMEKSQERIQHMLMKGKPLRN